jgi:putative membrane protein
MEKLIKAGTDTTQQYGKLYATIEAGAKRGEQEKMLFGAPADAQGFTAYSYELLGDDGEGSRNLLRGLGALGLLGLSFGGIALRRRLV